MDDNELPIIDAHHHFWDLSLGRHPWLRPDVLIPFRYGDYSAIKKNFMPEDYRAVTGHHRVVASVTMEGEWEEDDPVEETRWMMEIVAKHGTPAAHVARAFLHRDDVEEVLAGHTAYPPQARGGAGAGQGGAWRSSLHVRPGMAAGICASRALWPAL